MGQGGDYASLAPAGCQARPRTLRWVSSSAQSPARGPGTPRRAAPPLRLQTLDRSPCTRPQHPELLANSQVGPMHDSCIAAAPSLQEEPGIPMAFSLHRARRARGEPESHHPFARRVGIVARGTHWSELAMRRGDTMSRTTRRPPISGAKTRQPARRAVATLAVALLFGLAAAEARAGIAFVKNIGTNASATTDTTIAVTVPAAGVATGDSVILTLAMADASGGVTATDSKGNTYSLAADITNASNVRTVILAAHNVTALVSGDTITVTHPSASVRALSANEFSGLSPTSALDQTHTATGSSTAPSSGATAATTEAAELLLGAMGVAGPISDTFTAGTNYTALTRAGTGIGFRGAQSASSGSSSSATSLAISRPAGTVANDVMVASITSRTGSGTPTIAAPSGWTSIVSTNNTSTVTTATFWKVAGTAAADPGPYAFTVSSSSVAGGISAYFNVDTTNPINASGGQATSSAPSITTTVANTMLVACFGRSGSSLIGAPSGMTERFTAVTSGSNNAASESADVPQATAGATGSKASTGNTATIGQLIALAPSTSSAVTIDPEYRIVSLTGTYSAGGTLNPSRSWAASIATFRAACGDGNVDADEQCDLGAQNGQSGSCCTATCTFATVATVCRAALNECDLAESCTGSSATCPADAVKPAGKTCTDDGNVGPRYVGHGNTGRPAC